MKDIHQLVMQTLYKLDKIRLAKRLAKSDAVNTKTAASNWGSRCCVSEVAVFDMLLL
jgi:hypothetical protein